MSSGAADNIIGPSNDWTQPTYDEWDNPPPFTQDPIFEGQIIRCSYIDDGDEGLSVTSHFENPVYRTDSVDVGCSSNPGNQTPPQHLQHPQDPAHHQQPQHQPSSSHTSHYVPDQEGYGPPPDYNALQHAMTQHPFYPDPAVHDPQPGAYVFPAYGQCIVTQPQMFSGQPPATVVQPSLNNSPHDFMSYSIFVSLCCCWFIGLVAVFKSMECRQAITDGNRDLARAKSTSARNTAHAALIVGIVVYIVVGVIVGIRMASMTSRL